ncbi:hypothetical protein [Microbacterium elymi]|uniref:GCVT N-terminal domain-containing protein n=1 Tax=Microbacterium elymi TaxID=2909587 RepID=A0ABY5NI00_9MICO|nr:hypothetical protein [Microbacterium elymi]UUT34756.1 hypothetical protein L2X98_30345 [Microbacterium elymi]
MAWEFVSLEQGIAQAGSPIRLLWKPEAGPWAPPVVEGEYVGWRQEQDAWRSTVALSDLSYHMSDTFLRGSGAARLLSDVSANNIEDFAIGRAKQFVPVAADGNIVTDGILLRDGEESYVLSGVEAAQHWVTFHAQQGGYDVEFSTDPDRSFMPGDPRLFRLQVQGPRALDVVHRAFGGPLPETKFFHSTPVELRGATFRALRHGMAGQPGYEFIGDYADHDRVKEALLAAGEQSGIVHIGALAYATNGVESGWIPTPTPAIYTDPALAGLRASVNLFSYEGQNPLYGSFYSDDLADYYTSPWELGYGRSISFAHDFIGRDALQAAKDAPHRAKVTLAFDASRRRAGLRRRPRLPQRLWPPPHRAERRTRRADLPDHQQRPRAHGAGARARRCRRRRAGHERRGGLGAASRPRHRARRRSRVPAPTRHGAAGALQRVRPHGVPAGLRPAVASDRRALYEQMREHPQGALGIDRPAIFSPAAAAQDEGNDRTTIKRFGPLYLPSEYTNWADEASAHVKTAYLGDWSSLAKIVVRGPDAHAFLSQLGMNDLSRFEIGQIKHHVQARRARMGRVGGHPPPARRRRVPLHSRLRGLAALAAEPGDVGCRGPGHQPG